jgi:hypothetical protein
MKRSTVTMLAILVCAMTARAAQEPPHRKLAAVPFTDVKIADEFWTPRFETNRTKTVPHDFRKCEETGRISNFAKAGGLEQGEFRGIYFDDSDVYKVIEGAAYTLAIRPDTELDKYLDGLIAKIAAAQQKDGYLYTFYTVKKQLDKRWSNEKDMHETYCAGHLIEAAVAHFRATGKRNLLDVATRVADHIDSVFGPGRLGDVSGHEEIELALVKLYEVTGQERYLRLARFFIDERGNAKGHRLYGENLQDHKPVIEQDEPVGHAVRAMYLYCGMADLAAYLAPKGYVEALGRIWQNVATRRMYVTGGVGARHQGEAFGRDYELPNDTAYCETCAAIGNALWNYRMILLHGDAKYADVLERVIYNGFLSGISLDGEKFFYVNPLASKGNHHRQAWFGCACCPVNVVRFLPSLPGYVYAHDADGIYVNLYAAGTAKVARKGGTVALVQETRYPWDGKVRLTVQPERTAAFAVNLRIPAWTRASDEQGDQLYRVARVKDEPAVAIKVNGEPVARPDIAKGYACIKREWKKGDVLELDLPMPVRRVYAHPQVGADVGRVAIQRGPIVYCVEAADVGPGIASMYLPADAPLAAERRPDLLGGVAVIKGKAMTRSADPVDAKPFDLVAIPYYAWDHRDAGPMMVWLPEDPGLARPLAKPTVASTSRASASHVWRADTAGAINDQVEPKSSNDMGIPRFTWWDHKGTAEWAQYDFAKPRKVSSVEVYWFDDTGTGGCRVPKSWRLLYRAGDKWLPVAGASACGTDRDRFNRVTFTPVETDGLRIEAVLQAGFSGGILEWRVGPAE